MTINMLHQYLNSKIIFDPECNNEYIGFTMLFIYHLFFVRVKHTHRCVSSRQNALIINFFEGFLK